MFGVVRCYDENKVYIGSATPSIIGSGFVARTLAENTRFIRLLITSPSGQTANLTGKYIGRTLYIVEDGETVKEYAMLKVVDFSK